MRALRRLFVNPMSAPAQPAAPARQRDYTPRASQEHRPDPAWKLWGEEINPKEGPADTPGLTFYPQGEDPGEKPEGVVRVVCISDTHGKAESKWDPNDVPAGDVLLHAGDFTSTGLPNEVDLAAKFIASLPHPNKIVIAGNHDLSFDTANYGELWKNFRHPEQYDCEAMKDKLRAVCTYLEDAESVVQGVRIWGSPWQPEFCGWGFNLERGEECQQAWDKIPEGVDILVTHGPPLGHGDMVSGGGRAGCVNLLDTIEHKVKPKVHVFGHIHEGAGITNNGTTTFINASSCNLAYRAVNSPIVFDIALS